MNSNYFILSFILLPLTAFLAILFSPERKENLISRIAISGVGITFFSLIIFLVYWIFVNMPIYNVKEIVLYESREYVFLIDFYFDIVTAVYLLTGAFITFLTIRYSRYYMHLAKGYKRFFATILFFYFSYNFTILSGNFETLFSGWEFLGISSFLLVAFYKERYLPVRNAVKVFSVYRIGDIGILLAMWASHYLWHENITFAKLLNQEFVHHHLQEYSRTGFFVAVCLLVAASAKSAQFPFSFWIPRAMEGPTPSSAIFYGSLSIHLGVFLLLRTMPFWEQETAVRWLIGLVGGLTAVLGYFVARVQPTIKTQIAYASVAQIGLMFIEIALGLKTIALLHFMGNAFLRTYQLLVSPSVVAYMIREQFYHFKPYSHAKQKFWWGRKLYYGWYLLSLKEFYLDELIRKIVFLPFKWIGNRLNFITYQNVLFFFIPFYLLGWLLYFQKSYLPNEFNKSLLPVMFAGIALMMIMKGFSEHLRPRLAWLMAILGHLWIVLAVSHNADINLSEMIWYLSGILVAGGAGLACLLWLQKREKDYFTLQRYWGHSYKYPRLAFVFFLCCLGLMGFPITPTFIGEDLIFSHIRQEQYLMAFFLSSYFVIGGITLIRIYARLFLGIYDRSNEARPSFFS